MPIDMLAHVVNRAAEPWQDLPNQTTLQKVQTVVQGVIGVLNNGLDLLGVQSFWQEIAKGVIILLAVLFDVWMKRTDARRCARAGRT